MILTIEKNCRFENRHCGICGYMKLLPSAVIKCNQYKMSHTNQPDWVVWLFDEMANPGPDSGKP